MNFGEVQRAPRRHRARVWGAADGIGQSTGALLITGGGAEPGVGHRAGAWAGLTEGVMVSTGRAHPGGVLTITDERPHGRQPAQRPTGLQPAKDFQDPPGHRPARYPRRLPARHGQSSAGCWTVRHRGTVQQQPNQQQTRRRPAA